MLPKKPLIKLFTRLDLVPETTFFDPKPFNLGGISLSLPILLAIILSSTQGPIMVPKLARLHPLRVLVRG